MHHQGSIWDRNFGGGGGRRGVCRAHRITILKHMTQGWIQYLKGGGGTKVHTWSGWEKFKILLINIHYNRYISAS